MILITYICIDSSFLPLYIIYSVKSGNLQDTWLHNFNPNEHTCYFDSSEKGWTNDLLGLKWLEIFERHTRVKARHGRDWRVLWADGHGSHITMEFLTWCIEHRIHTEIYPPHSTYRLQPLDIGLFRPLSQYYSINLSQLIAATKGYLPIGK